LEWDSPLKEKDIQLLTLPRSSLSLSDLYQYIQILQRTKQSSVRYELALWEKIIMPFNVGLMLLMAIPFAFGPLRMATVGKKSLFGALAGLAYYFVSELLKHLGLLLGASPFITTTIPFVGLLVATGVFWRRYFY
jgi:lipopolysaccharide export system permease protein